MSDLVLRFPSGKIADFRKDPGAVYDASGKLLSVGIPRVILVDLDEAVRLTPDEIKALDAKSEEGV